MGEGAGCAAKIAAYGFGLIVRGEYVGIEGCGFEDSGFLAP